MRPYYIVALSFLTAALPGLSAAQDGSALRRRQNASSDSDFPDLTSSTPAPSTVSSAWPTATTTQSNDETSATQRSASSTAPLSAAQSTASRSLSASAASSTETGEEDSGQDNNTLPLEPRITPALGIAGVFLIALGGVYALIGVKSRWLQIFLSSGFLASIATTALVDYVMKPPVSDAIQGGFFVAIVMTGAVFGAGALFFKEFTEGLGCLLGGFTLSMWLLTLRPGGLIQSQGGKGAFIGIFCFVAWALSFTSYTRPYALIGSTAFSGATAFTLGIDCFTRVGIKEFWFYLWELNDNLFALDVETYPLTRGMRVEIVVIVIGTIIGILSQIKLWKVVRTKEKETEAQQAENARQSEAIGAVLGRHLQRHNDREKSQWERLHGDRLQSQRNTIMWKNAPLDKRYSSVSVLEVSGVGNGSPQARDLEMNALGPSRVPSTYSMKRKHQSTATIDVIEEVEEDPRTVAETQHHQRALRALERAEETSEDRRSVQRRSQAHNDASGAVCNHTQSNSVQAEDSHNGNVSTLRRKSQQSLKRLSAHLSPPYVADDASDSREQLIESERPYSRASSAAATMDEEDESVLAAGLADQEETTTSGLAIVVTPPASSEGETRESNKGTDTFSSDALGPESEPVTSSSQAEEKATGSDVIEKDGPQSQPSNESQSTSEILTADALSQVPTHLSNVVLSYRTNEWAKHIAEADAPVYEEPETIQASDVEAPTHLAKATAPSGSIIDENQPVVDVPPAEPLPSTVKAGGSGVGIAVQPTPSQRSLPRAEARRSATKAPSRPNSMQSLKLPGHRGSRTSFNPGSTTSLVTTPIDENVPTEFTAPGGFNRRSSTSPYMLPNRHSSAGSLPLTSFGGPHSAHVSNNVRLSGVYDRPQYRTTSQENLQSSSLVQGVRRDSYNSRLPAERNLANEAQKRQSLLADWRLSQQQGASSSNLMSKAMDVSRAQMRADKENQKMQQEYDQTAQQRKQYAIDQVMRRPDMQDLHREAMRRMQASANEKLRSSTR
ncbi:hypothetical protein B0A52_04991 [Exophiala mesophila]|uniref:TM7S3/TM198-like domain-containing protein n=1 Tax=Exophiala mesophila TaxID=212818 RepID=A0A438N6N7_EXOME|nr:hypothetical protein B0A52_04991 [Exophiala mesophila]